MNSRDDRYPSASVAQTSQPEMVNLFRQALAWGMVYGPMLDGDNWDDMSLNMALQFAEQSSSLSDVSNVDQTREQ